MPIIRKMRASDVDAVAELEQQIFRDAWTGKGIMDTLQSKQAFLLVAEEEAVLGYCIVYYVLDEGEIARIAVGEPFRKRGVGQAMLHAVEEICRSLGVTRLLLDVRESNETARKFYTVFGFKVDGIRKNFYDFPKEHAVLMSKDIP